MAKYKTSDLIVMHNNLAARKGRPQIPADAKMSTNEIAKRLEGLNKYPFKKRKPPRKSMLDRLKAFMR